MKGIILILIAWFVDMPLWLSILTTVLCGLSMLAGVKITHIDDGKNDFTIKMNGNTVYEHKERDD